MISFGSLCAHTRITIAVPHDGAVITIPLTPSERYPLAFAPYISDGNGGSFPLDLAAQSDCVRRYVQAMCDALKGASYDASAPRRRTVEAGVYTEAQRACPHPGKALRPYSGGMGLGGDLYEQCRDCGAVAVTGAL